MKFTVIFHNDFINEFYRLCSNSQWFSVSFTSLCVVTIFRILSHFGILSSLPFLLPLSYVTTQVRSAPPQVSCPHAESSESSSTCGDPESDLTFTSAYTGSATTTEVRNLSPATTYAFR